MVVPSRHGPRRLLGGRKYLDLFGGYRLGNISHGPVVIDEPER